MSTDNPYSNRSKSKAQSDIDSIPRPHRPLTDEEKEFVRDVCTRATAKTVAKVIGVDHRVVWNYLNVLRRRGEFFKGSPKGNTFNYHSLKAYRETGNDKAMLNEFFVIKHGETWSSAELSHIEDTSGDKSISELSHSMGRSEYALQKVKASMKLDAVRDSGYWSYADVANYLGMSAKFGGALRRRVKSGQLERVPGTGHARKTLLTQACKLRYHVRDKLRRPKVIRTKRVMAFIKLNRFKKLMFAEASVERFINSVYPNKQLDCTLCHAKTEGSLYCSRCQGSSVLNMG